MVNSVLTYCRYQIYELKMIATFSAKSYRNKDSAKTDYEHPVFGKRLQKCEKCC